MFYAFAPAFLHNATPFSCEYLNAKMLHTCQNNQIYELAQAVLSRAAKIQHFDISDLKSRNIFKTRSYSDMYATFWRSNIHKKKALHYAKKRVQMHKT